MVSKALLINEALIAYGDNPNSRKQSWQAEFPQDTECCKCGSEARLAFVVKEEEGDKKFAHTMHQNELAGLGPAWLHDAVAVAIYFCKKCLEPTALYNQA